MTKILYFAYGMNTNLGSMAMRCPGAVSLGYAVLPNHHFRFAYHADVVPDDHNDVDGVLWEITEEHLLSLDCTEGFPSYYDRKEVTVRHNGSDRLALVYFMQPGHFKKDPPESYLRMLIEGYQENLVPLRQLVNSFDYVVKM
jgi:gamma-glutamylcyclotransferase (GGCT)/AIG2-like uncharacterized protein YtfP